MSKVENGNVKLYIEFRNFMMPNPPARRAGLFLHPRQYKREPVQPVELLARQAGSRKAFQHDTSSRLFTTPEQIQNVSKA